MLRIHEVKLGLDQDTTKIPDKIKAMIKINGLKIFSFKIIKESIDARDKNNIYLIYSVDFQSDKDREIIKKCTKLKLDQVSDEAYIYPKSGDFKLSARPIVIGFGPCGMFAALVLAEMGYKPIIIERGKEIYERARDVAEFWNNGKLNTNSNVQFGEGGAGAFSDGKLTTQIKDKRVKKVLEEFVEAGAEEKIVYQQKPHIGTDVLRGIVVNIREKILSMGGEIHFESQFVGFENGKIKIEKNMSDFYLDAEAVVLAIGHSARDTFYLLNEIGLNMEQKPFSMGVRIEHPQDFIDKTQFGKFAGNERLGAAEYKLAYHCENE